MLTTVTINTAAYDEGESQGQALQFGEGHLNYIAHMGDLHLLRHLGMFLDTSVLTVWSAGRCTDWVLTVSLVKSKVAVLSLQGEVLFLAPGLEQLPRADLTLMQC